MTDRPAPTPPLTPEVLPFGLDGLLVRFALSPTPQAMAATQAMAAELSQAPPPGTVEIAPALVSVLIRHDPHEDGGTLAATLLDQARRIAAGPLTPPKARRRWTIPAAFGDADGPHLTAIAAAMGLTPQAAAQQICEADLRVLAIGFAPGQPYLGLLPQGWDLPRLSDLTPQVPAGALVVALRQVVMFGNASATGWQQVGRCAFRSFQPDRRPPMPLKPGDSIRFAAVSASDLAALEGAPDGLGGARLRHLE